MFLCVGVLYDRMHSRADRRLRRRGQHDAQVRRVRDAVRDGQRGLPGTSGFVGEFLVILAAVKVNFWIAFARRHLADPRRRLHAVDVQARDLRRRRQRARRGAQGPQPRASSGCWRRSRRPCWSMGVYPKPFIDVMHVSVTDLLAHVAQSKL